MIERTLQHWRELPHLRVKECAVLAGLSPREMEGHLADLEVRRIGRLRFVTTPSFRRWLGEEVTAPAETTVELDTKAKRWAARTLREIA